MQSSVAPFFRSLRSSTLTFVLPLAFALFGGGVIPGAGAQGVRRAPAVASPGDALRSLCANWRAESEVAPLLAEARLAPLRYQEGQLHLDLSRPLVVDEGPRGVVEVFPAAPAEAVGALSVEDGARLVREQASGKLTGRLQFLPERGPLTGSPCLVIGGGRVLRVRVVPLWVSLTSAAQGGREQARLHTPRGETLTSEGRPEAQLDNWGLIFEGDPKDREGLGPLLAPLSAKALSCYEQALAQQSDLSGRVVLGADADRDGRITEVRVELDTTGEADLVRCLREGAEALRLPKLRRPAHLSLPLSLRRAPAGGSGDAAHRPAPPAGPARAK